MKVKERKNSLIAVTALTFVLYAIVLLVMYFGLHTWTEWQMNNAFPTMSDLLRYETELRSGQYHKIPQRRFKNASYIVFDEDTNVVYASNPEVKEKIQPDDLLLINDYESDAYYTVYEKQENGVKTYEIHYENRNEETGITEETGSCVLDENLHIVSGDLFLGWEYLTEREFQFVKGLYNTDETITKFTFEASDGSQQTLVFIGAKLNEARYNMLLRNTRETYLWLIPAIGSISLLLAYLIIQKLQKQLHVLNTEIHQMKEKNHQVDRSKIPVEFYTTVDALERLMDQVNREEKSRKQIIAGLSHDLKTPLSVIQGCAGAFCEGLVPKEQEQKYMEMMRNRSQVASQLLDTLFEYAKMELQDYPLHTTHIDICEFMKECLSEKYNEITDAGFLLDIAIAEETCDVEADPVLLARCVENLLNNCLKHNQPGTTIFVSVQEDAENAVLKVGDNGIGVDPKIADSLFDSFVMGDDSRTSGKGSGLGLAIVKRIIELHKGTIVLRSDSKYKTLFEIHLPKRER